MFRMSLPRLSFDTRPNRKAAVSVPTPGNGFKSLRKTLVVFEEVVMATQEIIRDANETDMAELELHFP